VFRIEVYAAYWVMNRCGLPLELGQKWTASNVTIVGGQLIDPNSSTESGDGERRGERESLEVDAGNVRSVRGADGREEGGGGGGGGGGRGGEGGREGRRR